MRDEFWREIYFQTSEPVQYYRFRVHAPKKKPLHYQVHGLQIEPEITEANYTRTYTFEVRDVPPLREESFMPVIEDLAHSISISSLASWDKLIEWYATLIREQDYLTPELKERRKRCCRELGVVKRRLSGFMSMSPRTFAMLVLSSAFGRLSLIKHLKFLKRAMVIVKTKPPCSQQCLASLVLGPIPCSSPPENLAGFRARSRHSPISIT